MSSSIPERLLLARSKRGFSQHDLSIRAGLSKAYVNMVESGRIKDPGNDCLKALADACDVPVEWLAFNSGDEPEWSAAPQRKASPSAARRVAGAGRRR